MSLRLRLWLDLAMFTAMIASLGYHFTGNTWHELLGLGFTALFGAHTSLNQRWYKGLPQGRYGLSRNLRTAVNALLLVAALTMIVSGLANSRLIETYLGLKTDILSRQVHTTAAYWTLVLVSVHAGLHTSVITAEVKRIVGLPRWPGSVTLGLWGTLGAALGFGVYAAFDRELCSKLFAVYSFDFWDPSFPAFLFFAEYLAVAAVYATLGHWMAKSVKGLA
jgi:Domain of unknown function (DUF4405)